jgi:hypothetical protein
MVAATPVAPKLLVGGGGPKIMHLAGRVADIVSMIPRQPSGDWSVADSLSDSTLACMAQKARWVSAGAESAGRDPDTVELHTMVARTVIGDDIEATLAEEASANGATPEQLADSTLFLLGTGGEARDRLCSWREGTGISYVSFFEPGEEQIVRLAEDVVLPLTVARSRTAPPEAAPTAGRGHRRRPISTGDRAGALRSGALYGPGLSTLRGALDVPPGGGSTLSRWPTERRPSADQPEARGSPSSARR